MHGHSYHRLFTPVVINFFTKKHPPSGYWPSWQCVLLPFSLVAVIHFILLTQFPQLMGEGGASFLWGTEAETWFQSLLWSLLWSFITTYCSFSIYALIVRDKPERPWLWCLIAVLFWPAIFGMFAILPAIDYLRNL